MVESIKGKRLNKGEWAEFYVMLRLLGEGRLYAADNLLRKKYTSYLDVLKIIRQEFETQVLEYVVDRDHDVVVIKSQDRDEIITSVPIRDFTLYASELFDGIKNQTGSSVPAPDSVCDFARVIYVSKPKAPAVKALKRLFGGKNDIFIEVRDGQTAIVSVMGFSIKSKFGQNPTLFNAGSSSQFLYKLSFCNDTLMNEFNTITDGKGRGWALCKEYLLNHEITLDFYRAANPVYDANMFLVRESMSQIMAWCVKDRLIDSPSDYGVKETIERMASVRGEYWKVFRDKLKDEYGRRMQEVWSDD